MSDKRKRTTTVLCTDQVWSDLQRLASERGKTLAQLLGELVENQAALGAPDRQGTLADVVEARRPESVPQGPPPRTLIGFGHRVVRVR
jgi:hypothetical protein